LFALAKNQDLLPLLIYILYILIFLLINNKKWVYGPRGLKPSNCNGLRGARFFKKSAKTGPKVGQTHFLDYFLAKLKFALAKYFSKNPRAKNKSGHFYTKKPGQIK
jgi:hypothetical protein